MWMSDKPLNQQRLARDLAGLVDALQGKENVLGWFRAYWTTMAREWGGIDALRMDKFLYLVRCYVGKGFEYVRGVGWEDEKLVEEYLVILQEGPLDLHDGKIPNGLRYHVTDIYVDELDKADTGRNAPLDMMLAPLRRLGKESLTKAVRKRVGEALDDERLKDWVNAGAETEAEDEDAEATEQSTNDVDGDDDDEFRGFEN